jgi:hypothetical protein
MQLVIIRAERGRRGPLPRPSDRAQKYSARSLRIIPRPESTRNFMPLTGRAPSVKKAELAPGTKRGS